MSDYTLIPLKQIKPDPNQPRKSYADASFDELVDSVREKGVIQPILVRPHGKGWMVICGERRYRAAISVATAFKDRDSIPAIIREASDEEALELQLVENALRSDVHPMEEAAAFLKLTDNLNVDTISKKTGKSPYYIRQRLTLNNLTAEWQKAFKRGAISIETALTLSGFTEAAQQGLYKDSEVNENLFGSPGYEITFTEWSLRNVRGDLSQAPFDTEDANLIAGAPACSRCAFNSACSQLFPDESKAICGDVVCYKEKAHANFKQRLKEAEESADMIYIVDNYGFGDGELVKLAKKHGIDRVLDRNSFSIIEEPEKPDYKEWLEDIDYDEFGSKEDVEKEWQKVLSQYKEELSDYEAKVSSGKYKRALVVNDSPSKGKIYYISLSKKANVSGTKTSKDTAAKEEEGTITIADIDAEINRIKAREEVSMKSDERKIWSALHPHFNPVSNTKMIQGELSQLEMEVIANAIYDKLGYPGHDDFRKLFNLKGKDYFKGITMATLIQMLRFFYLTVIPPAPTTLYNGFNDKALLSMRIADEFFPTVITEIKEAQYAIARKRSGKVADRILELQHQKQDLKKAAKKTNPSPKKTATKK